MYKTFKNDRILVMVLWLCHERHMLLQPTHASPTASFLTTRRINEHQTHYLQCQRLPQHASQPLGQTIQAKPALPLRAADQNHKSSHITLHEEDRVLTDFKQLSTPFHPHLRMSQRGTPASKHMRQLKKLSRLLLLYKQELIVLELESYETLSKFANLVPTQKAVSMLQMLVYLLKQYRVRRSLPMSITKRHGSKSQSLQPHR